MAGGFVFVLLFLYSIQGICESFCLDIGWSSELDLRLLGLISVPRISSHSFFEMGRGAGSAHGGW